MFLIGALMMTAKKYRKFGPETSKLLILKNVVLYTVGVPTSKKEKSVAMDT